MKKSALKEVMKETASTEPVVTDYLMWVGSIYYPTVDVFIREAKKKGISKRLGHLPYGLTPGRSKIFLAHDDGLVGKGFIFGYFIPDRLEFLAEDEADIPYGIFDRVEWISSWQDEEERECGLRESGIYATCIAREEDESIPHPKGKVVFFDQPRSLKAFDPGRKHFRGLLAIPYGDDVINADESVCVVPLSRQEPKHAGKKLDDGTLIKAFKKGKTMAYTAQTLAYHYGIKKSTVLYRWFKLTGKVQTKHGPLDDAEEEAAEKFEAKIEKKRLAAEKKAVRNLQKVLPKF